MHIKQGWAGCVYYTLAIVCKAQGCVHTIKVVCGQTDKLLGCVCAHPLFCAMLQCADACMPTLLVHPSKPLAHHHTAAGWQDNTALAPAILTALHATCPSNAMHQPCIRPSVSTLSRQIVPPAPQLNPPAPDPRPSIQLPERRLARQGLQHHILLRLQGAQRPGPHTHPEQQPNQHPKR